MSEERSLQQRAEMMAFLGAMGKPWSHQLTEVSLELQDGRFKRFGQPDSQMPSRTEIILPQGKVIVHKNVGVVQGIGFNTAYFNKIELEHENGEKTTLLVQLTGSPWNHSYNVFANGVKIDYTYGDLDLALAWALIGTSIPTNAGTAFDTVKWIEAWFANPPQPLNKEPHPPEVDSKPMDEDRHEVVPSPSKAAWREVLSRLVAKFLKLLPKFR